MTPQSALTEILAHTAGELGWQRVTGSRLLMWFFIPGHARFLAGTLEGEVLRTVRVKRTPRCAWAIVSVWTRILCFQSVMQLLRIPGVRLLLKCCLPRTAIPIRAQVGSNWRLLTLQNKVSATGETQDSELLSANTGTRRIVVGGDRCFNKIQLAQPGSVLYRRAQVAAQLQSRLAEQRLHDPAAGHGELQVVPVLHTATTETGITTVFQRVSGRELNPWQEDNWDRVFAAALALREQLWSLEHSDDLSSLREQLSFGRYLAAIQECHGLNDDIQPILKTRFLGPLETTISSNSRLCHGDLWLGNLIESSTGLFLMDFDDAGFFPDGFDIAHLAFHELTRRTQPTFGRWWSPIDAEDITAEITTKLGSHAPNVTNMLRQTLNSFNLDREQVSVLEACYFRTHAAMWSASPHWHPDPARALWNIAEYCDRIDAHGSGILVRLTDWQ